MAVVVLWDCRVTISILAVLVLFHSSAAVRFVPSVSGVVLVGLCCHSVCSAGVGRRMPP